MLLGQLALEMTTIEMWLSLLVPQTPGEPLGRASGLVSHLHRASAAAPGSSPCHRALGAVGMGQGRGAWAAPAPALHTASPTGNAYTGCSLEGVLDSLRFLLKILSLEAIWNS